MKLNLSRLGLFALIGAALVATGLSRPAPAAADQPIKQFLASEDTLVEGVCAFPVLLHTLANKEYQKTYVDQNGNLVMDTITGVFKFHVTNETSGKSIDINISGSSEAHYYSDGSGEFSVTGPTLYYYFPPEFPAMFVNSGLYRYNWDAQGNSSYSFTGHMIDICQALE